MTVRYPACPVCARPLFPHAGPRSLERPTLCCVNCAHLVEASPGAVDAANRAAAADGLAPVRGTFRRAEELLFASLPGEKGLGDRPHLSWCIAFQLAAARRDGGRS